MDQSADATAGIESNVRRRGVLAGAGLGGAMALLGAGRHAARAADTGPFPTHPRWKFLFVNHLTTHPFFVPTQYGIQDACALLGCDYQWSGSANGDVAETVNAVNSAIAAKADGIAVPIIDPKAFDRPVQRALDVGIPVFAYNTDRPADSVNARLAFIGQAPHAAGYQLGQRIAALVDGGMVALFIAARGGPGLQPRLDGALDAIRASAKKLDVQIVTTGAALNEAQSRIKAFTLAHPDLKAMIAVDAGSTQGVAEAMQAHDLAKQGVHAGGFDLLPRTLELIKAGHLDVTIDQQPYLQGFYTVMQMFAFKVSGGLIGPAEVNTGLKFVTRESVDAYLSNPTRYEGRSEQPSIVLRSGAIRV